MNSSEKSVSIIVPTLNEEKYIGILLDSLCDQTEKNFEIIVVDANSTDNTHQIVDKYINRLNIQFVIAPQKGVSHQRNYGARLATSDYLMFIDADGFIKPTFIADILKYMHNHPKVDLVVTWALPLSTKKVYKAMFYMYNIIFMDMIKNIKPVVQMGGFIFTKKRIFEALGGYSITHAIGEDHDFIERAFSKRFVVKLLRRPIVYTSVRRLEIDGLPKYLYNVAKATFYHLNGGVTNSIANSGKVDYKMDGGSYYDSTKDV